MFHWINDLIGLLPHWAQGWVHVITFVGLPLFLAWQVVKPRDD
ncbi:hypothetical protein [Deinococcus sp. KNUC1210]|nr:hypothetical protein [Deinococcus sp. KNUC1210]